MDLDKIKGLSEECVLCLGVDGIVEGFSGSIELFFGDSVQLKGAKITEVVDFYDYNSGAKLEAVRNDENSIVSISTEAGAITVQLKVLVKDEKTYLLFKKLDYAEKAIVQKCELENKKDFLDALGKLSHDFNNLLGVVMGHAELANYIKGNEESRTKHINQVLVSSTKIKNLLKQVLVYRHHLDEKPKELCDLKTIIDMAVSDVRLSIDDSISIKVKYSNSITIKQSMSKLMDVFRNLIKNAVESIDREGSVYIEIESSEGAYHKVIIRDNGVGMSNKTKEKMFEPFYSTNSRMKSVGVGLAIAKGILDSIGGSLEIRSELEKGTEVEVFIPVYLDLEQKGRVLLVDDEQLVLEVTGEMVESLGYEVVRCEDVKQGEEALSSELFDVLLIDHHLNDDSGMDLIEYARNQGIKTPAILSCGHHQECDFEKGKIDGFLMKPSSMKEIETMFNSVLSR